MTEVRRWGTVLRSVRSRPDAGLTPSASARRLIVNADDFGRSQSINEAVIQAHARGILTTASLMVNEPACARAVALAREHPALGVGLHLSLVRGQAALTHTQAPGLVGPDQQFSPHPIRAGWNYFWRPALRESLRAEIHAQFAKFHQTGLPLDHVNGHLHLHLHPAILRILTEDAPQLGLERLRLTRDPLGLNLRLAKGRWSYRLAHWLIYRVLAGRAAPALAKRGIRHTQRVFGLLQDGRVDETFLCRLLHRLPEGDSELYSHPSLAEGKHEFDALVSPQVGNLARRLNIRLVRYQDLTS